MASFLQDSSVGLGFLVAMLVALELGYRAGLRARAVERDGAGSQVGAIQGAVLGLLGLLLAFSFAAAGSRFLERQDLIAEEANAIGTAWLRADLLDEPHRAELRSALEEYTAHRIALSKRMPHGWDAAAIVEVGRLQDRIWRAARDAVAGRPELVLPVLSPVNEVLDVHTLRVNATLKHLPWLVMGLLVVYSLLAVTVIGYGNGMDGRHRWILTLTLVLLITSALWITVDLDRPRRGLLQLDDGPLQALSFGSG